MTKKSLSKKARSAGDQTGIVDFYSPEVLVVMDSRPPSGVARVALLALVEDRGKGLLTNRIYFIDVVLAGGETRSFLQGYAGGGSFSENNFVGNATRRGDARLVHEFSDSWCDADEDLEYDDSIGLAETLAAQTIAGFDCNYDGEDDVPRFPSLKGFTQLPDEDDLHIQYRVWCEKSMLPRGLVEADWVRFQTMLEKSGVTISVRR